MPETIGVMAILIISIVFAILPISNIQKDKRKIRAVLEKKDATNIEIAYIPFNFDRISGSYEVQYHDANGKYHKTKCKVNVWDSIIYWVEEDLT